MLFCLFKQLSLGQGEKKILSDQNQKISSFTVPLILQLRMFEKRYLQ